MDAAMSPRVSEIGCGCLTRLSQRGGTYRDSCAEIDALSDRDLIRRFLESDARLRRLKAEQRMLLVLIGAAKARAAGSSGGDGS